MMLKRNNGMLLLLIMTLVMTACSANKWSNWESATKSYNTSLQTLILLRKADHIDDDLYREIEPLRAAAAAGLDAMEASAKLDNDMAFDQSKKAFWASLTEWGIKMENE